MLGGDLSPQEALGRARGGDRRSARAQSPPPPLREDDRKEGGFYSVLKSYALPRTRCTSCAISQHLSGKRLVLGASWMYLVVLRGRRPTNPPPTPLPRPWLALAFYLSAFVSI